jgi:hypothetical protein
MRQTTPFTVLAGYWAPPTSASANPCRASLKIRCPSVDWPTTWPGCRAAGTLETSDPLTLDGGVEEPRAVAADLWAAATEARTTVATMASTAAAATMPSVPLRLRTYVMRSSSSRLRPPGGGPLSPW